MIIVVSRRATLLIKVFPPERIATETINVDSHLFPPLLCFVSSFFQLQCLQLLQANAQAKSPFTYLKAVCLKLRFCSKSQILQQNCRQEDQLLQLLQGSLPAGALLLSDWWRSIDHVVPFTEGSSVQPFIDSSQHKPQLNG